MKKFKVVKCPKCSKIQVTSAKTLKCKFCNKSTKIKYKNRLDYSLWIYASFDTGTEASKFINQFKNKILEEKWKEKED